MDFLNKYVSDKIVDLICENNDENIVYSIILNKELVSNNIELLSKKGIYKIEELLISYLELFLMDTDKLNNKLIDDKIKLINEDVINVENL